MLHLSHRSDEAPDLLVFWFSVGLIDGRRIYRDAGRISKVAGDKQNVLLHGKGGVICSGRSHLELHRAGRGHGVNALQRHVTVVHGEEIQGQAVQSAGEGKFLVRSDVDIGG